MTKERAYQLRAIIEAAVQSLDDKTASTAAELFPRLRCDAEQTADTKSIPAGTKINWKGTIMSNSVTLWDTEACNPDNMPDMWVALEYKQGYRIAPEVFTVTNAAAKDECMWFGEALYKSLVDGNVYTPEQAPGNWELVA